jgi:hypothetical protein
LIAVPFVFEKKLRSENALQLGFKHIAMLSKYNF